MRCCAPSTRHRGTGRCSGSPAGEAEPVLEVARTTAAQLGAELARAAGHVFDVESVLPLRCSLFRLSDREHVLLVLLHHIASDGWSVGPLLADLGTAYTARRAGAAPGWAPLPVQYADYAVWQRELLSGQSDPGSLLAEQLRYWRQALARPRQELALPADRPRPEVASYRGQALQFRIDAALHARLLDCATPAGPPCSWSCTRGWPRCCPARRRGGSADRVRGGRARGRGARPAGRVFRQHAGAAHRRLG